MKVNVDLPKNGYEIAAEAEMVLLQWRNILKQNRIWY